MCRIWRRLSKRHFGSHHRKDRSRDHKSCSQAEAYSVGIVVAFASLVYFELDAKIPAAVAVEYGVGFVVIVLYAAVALKTTVAVIAIWFVIIAVAVVGVISVNNSATVNTGIVVVIIAIVAERSLRVSCVIFEQDRFAAV